MDLYLPSIKDKNNILIPYNPNSFYCYQRAYIANGVLNKSIFKCPFCDNCEIYKLIIDFKRYCIDSLECYNCKEKYTVFVFVFTIKDIDKKILSKWNYCFFYEVKTILI